MLLLLFVLLDLQCLQTDKSCKMRVCGHHKLKSQGVDFYKSFPSSGGRPRGPASTRSRGGKRTVVGTSSTSGGVRQPTLSSDVAA